MDERNGPRAETRTRVADLLASPAVRFTLLVLFLAGAATLVVTVGTPSRVEIEAFIARAGLAGPLLFILLYVVLSVLLFPGSVLTAAGGFAFGALFGTVYSVAGATGGAVSAYYVARWLGRAQVERLTGRRLGKIDTWLEQHGFLAILYVRLVPVFPFNALNYAAGVTAVRPLDYALGTALGIIPGTFAFAALGGSIDDPTSPAFLGAVALLAALIIGGPFIHRAMQRRGKAPATDEDADAG